MSDPDGAVGPRPRTAAVVTVSDGVARGVREDRSGPVVADLLARSGFDVTRREVVADERERVSELLAELAAAGVGLVATTGGTGLGPRDVTPEATRDVLDREAPGLAEEMRAAGRGSTPFAALSRGVAGTRGSTLILNLPGSSQGAAESLGAVLAILPHALDLLAGRTEHGAAGAVRATPVAHGEHHEHDEAAGGRRAPRVVATAVKLHGDPPCRVGQRMVIGPNGPVEGTLGCAEFDAAAVADAPGLLSSGRPATRTYEHDLGSVEVYLEPQVSAPALLVFSATPVAATVVRWAPDLGFDTTLVEPRADRATPAGTRVLRSLDGVALGPDTFAVHTDHDAPGVAESVAMLLRSSVGFVGVMGSRRHVGPHIERLRAMGVTDEDLARIRTPTGLDVGARSPEEIALSILAGVVAARRGAPGGWLDRPETAAHDEGGKG